MSGHLSDDAVIDALDGRLDAASVHHLQACPECRAAVEEMREDWDSVREADMPEPSPLYWDAFRAQVGRRIDHESRILRYWRAGAGLAAAAAVAAIVMLRGVPAPGSAELATVPPWTALPPEDEDESLPVLSAVASNLEWACSAADCLAELSEEESAGLTEALRQELQGRVL